MNEISVGFNTRNLLLRFASFFACMIITMIVATAPQGTELAFAANNISGDALAQAAESEFSTMSKTNSEEMRYGKKYWTWAYSLKGETPKMEDWCAYFVAYCAQQAGLFRAEIYPCDWGTFAGVGKTKKWLIDQGCLIWQNDGTYIPRRGDLAIQYLNGAPNHIEIVTGFSNNQVHTIGGNAGEYSEMLPHNKYLGETWKEFIRPSFGIKAAISLSKARITGVVNKTYDGTTRYQTASCIKIFVGGRQLAYNSDYTLEYCNEPSIPNLYRRPTEGKGAWIIARAKGSYKDSSETARYKIVSDTAYFLRKKEKSGWDLRLTRNVTTMKNLKKAGYRLSATIYARPSSHQSVHEFYNEKLKLHRYTFSASVGKRLVKCGYKANGIVAFSDPATYDPNSGKLYAACYHNPNTGTNDKKKFQYCGFASGYGSTESMDSEMKRKHGTVRTYKMIEYPKPVIWP